METLEAIKKRQSIRKYLTKSVDNKLIEKVINAGRLAATARNVQPWKFVIVTNREKLDKLVEINDYADFLKEAPVCILVFCKADAKYYLEDGCAATQNILIAATALGLGTCWIAGDKKPYIDKIAALVNAPENYTLVSSIALGYPIENHPSQPAKLPLNEILHWEEVAGNNFKS